MQVRRPVHLVWYPVKRSIKRLLSDCEVAVTCGSEWPSRLPNERFWQSLLKIQREQGLKDLPALLGRQGWVGEVKAGPYQLQ